MPVVRVGELQPGDQVLIVRYERVGSVFVHEHTSALKLCTSQIGTVSEKS